MNLKTIFGAILTILGIAGLIYAAVVFAGNTEVYKIPAIYGIIGLIFFITGISLIRTINDVS